MTRTRTLLSFAVPFALIFTVSSCSSGSGADKNMKTMSAADAKEKLATYGRKVEEIVGHGEVIWTEGVAGPCGERYKQLAGGASDPYAIVNFGRIEKVPAGQMEVKLTHLKQVLEGQGWTAVKDELKSGKAILDLSLDHPDGFSVVLEGLQREHRIVVSVGSPCLHRPAGDTEQ